MNGVARRAMLEQAISIKTIILHAYKEALDEKHAKVIEDQIKETKERLQKIGEINGTTSTEEEKIS